MRHRFAILIVVCLATLCNVSAQTKFYLKRGETLKPGEWLISRNDKYVAAVQADGNLCVSRGLVPTNALPLWCLRNHALPTGDYFLAMQTDGNLCTYPGKAPAATGNATWCSRTNGGDNYNLHLQDDGNLCVTRISDHREMWCSGSQQPRGDPALDNDYHILVAGNVGGADGISYLMRELLGKISTTHSPNDPKVIKVADGCYEISNESPNALILTAQHGSGPIYAWKHFPYHPYIRSRGNTHIWASDDFSFRCVNCSAKAEKEEVYRQERYFWGRELILVRQSLPHSACKDILTLR